MVFIDGTVVNVALPALQRALGATLGDAQWIVEAYELMLAALLLVGGAAGDRFGRRRVFAIGVAVFTVASVACGLSDRVGALIAGRSLQGVGVAPGRGRLSYRPRVMALRVLYQRSAGAGRIGIDVPLRSRKSR